MVYSGLSSTVLEALLAASFGLLRVSAWSLALKSLNVLEGQLTLTLFSRDWRGGR